MTGQTQALPVSAGTWRVSDSRTSVTFTVRNFGHPVHGSVACSSGEVELDDSGTPLRARAELDLNGLGTGVARRDADLRKPNLLDIDRHPVMLWSADRFRRTDAGWAAEGQLTVRGTTAPLTVTASAETAGAGWVRIRAHGTLDRRSVGIRAPRVLIGHVVAIEVDAWLAPPG